MDDAADVDTLLAKGIVRRRLTLAAGKRWRHRMSGLAHRHGLRTYDGHVGTEAWVAVAGQRTNYRRW